MATKDISQVGDSVHEKEPQHFELENTGNNISPPEEEWEEPAAKLNWQIVLAFLVSSLYLMKLNRTRKRR